MGLKKIAITGPESTGKSWLGSQLALHYNDMLVPEFARGYIDQLDRDYTFADILAIARGQLALEREKAALARNFLFCDTELVVTKIWSLHKFGTCDPFILEQIKKHSYDLFLLCDVDLPWEYDKQREHPDLRDYFFEWYKRELIDYGFPFEIISGTGKRRLEHAVAAIDGFFSMGLTGSQ